jgi:hypothetical protein
MWLNQRVSVVLMTYAERDSIRGVIRDFEAIDAVDEIIVVNNNAQVGTSEQVMGTSAIEYHEARQGYGYATRRGLKEATGDLIVLVEPDGTFVAADIEKLLVYSNNCDAVFGTRTCSQFIGVGANMGRLLRWGNWLVAKGTSLLFTSSHLSDVGCTYRLITRELRDAVLPRLRIGGSQLGPELMVQVIVSGARYVEVPVTYRARVGTSSVTGDLGKAFVLGLQMVALVCKLRIQTLGQRPYYTPLRPAGDTIVQFAPQTDEDFTPARNFA